MKGDALGGDEEDVTGGGQQTPGRDPREITLRAQSEARKARSMHNHCLTGFGLSWMTALGSAATLATGHVGHLGPLPGIAAGALGVAASVGGCPGNIPSSHLFVAQLQYLEKMKTH